MLCHILRNHTATTCFLHLIILNHEPIKHKQPFSPLEFQKFPTLSPKLNRILREHDFESSLQFEWKLHRNTTKWLKLWEAIFSWHITLLFYIKLCTYLQKQVFFYRVYNLRPSNEWKKKWCLCYKRKKKKV